MRKQYHILNGDSLKEQLPDDIQGEIIVARECLVDGNVNGENLNDLFSTRAEFITEHYGGTEKEYYEMTASEFLKILEVNAHSDINLWFEDDLFCQVNFWFVISLLQSKKEDNQIFLIRPNSHSQYGFSGLQESELLSIYKNKILLVKRNKISSLWDFYQSDNFEKLLKTATELKQEYPFILPAVEAHIQRTPVNGNRGRPTDSLIAIMEELKTEEFETVFQEFKKRESIYGFGDLQVRRLFDEIPTTSEWRSTND